MTAQTAQSGHAATVEYEHVTKSYDAAAVRKGAGAVNDLSLTIPAGKICVLVGPSGCGKTTSLKMVNRLIEPTSGRILIDGKDAAKQNPTELRRGIGYVIQQVGLFPHQTIEQNVGTVPRLLGWPEARWKARSEELLVDGRARPGQVRPAASRLSSRVASASASASPEPSRPTRRSCSWTSRSAPSTRSSGSACRTSSCASRRRSPRRSCS